MNEKLRDLVIQSFSSFFLNFINSWNCVSRLTLLSKTAVVVVAGLVMVGPVAEGLVAASPVAIGLVEEGL